jgi:hypothetical protein
VRRRGMDGWEGIEKKSYSQRKPKINVIQVLSNRTYAI